MSSWLEALFPGLRGTVWRTTSAADRIYNCIAWAAGQTNAWWWPIVRANDGNIFWPAGVPLEETIPAFVAAFATVGYIPCDNEILEIGFEEVALFVDSDRIPSHAARQLNNGQWTSKLGIKEDIEHPLHAIEGEVYGSVVQILKRPRSA